MHHNLAIFNNLSILYVEDDFIMLTNTAETLNVFFKTVYTATNINDAFEIYEDNKPDLILSDIKLKDGNGLDFVKRIRVNDYQTPIILLSSYSDQELILDAANIGIDGYLIKPLNLEKILTTFSKAVKRIPFIDTSIVLSKNYNYNYFKKELYRNNKIIDLGEKENKLFDFFINNANKTVSREEIIYHIWPLDNITDSALKNLLSRVRKKVGIDIIQTVKNRGWILKIDF